MGVSIDEWRRVKPGCELSLKYALAYQPVIVEVFFGDFLLVNDFYMDPFAYYGVSLIIDLVRTVDSSFINLLLHSCFINLLFHLSYCQPLYFVFYNIGDNPRVQPPGPHQVQP
jgi:hypothetical protein